VPIDAAYQKLAHRFNQHVDAANQASIILHEALQEVVAYRCVSQYGFDQLYGYAFVQDPQDCWWIMISLKYFPSGSLHDFLCREAPASQTIAAILTQASLLKYQGPHHWSHNDFKYDNIMISRTEEERIAMRDKTGATVLVETCGIKLHAIDLAWSTLHVTQSLQITSRAPLEFVTQPMRLENENTDMAQLITSMCRICPDCKSQDKTHRSAAVVDQLSWETVAVEIC
jgi:hypothetical protein